MKNIITAIAIVIVIGLIGFFGPFKTYAPTQIPISTSTPIAEVEGNTSTTTKLIIKNNAESKLVEDLKKTWINYVAATKAHDIEKIKNFSYAISGVCENKADEKLCFDVMDKLVKAVSSLKMDEFTNLWYDDKQAILLTELKPDFVEGNPGFYQPRILFAKKDGAYKVLAVMPEWGRFANKKLVKEAEISDFLKRAILDSDKDGLTDMEENCDGGEGYGTIKGCDKTSIVKNDTDGDLWWDGIEIYFR